MVTDPIADTFTRIRNAQRAGHRAVRVGGSKAIKNVLGVLKSEGFVEGFDLKKDERSPFGEFEVRLKYFSTGSPAITTARRMSKPGRRIYSSTDKMSRVMSGLGIAILSTSQGVMSDRVARKKKVGGEIIAYVG